MEERALVLEGVEQKIETSKKILRSHLQVSFACVLHSVPLHSAN